MLNRKAGILLMGLFAAGSFAQQVLDDPTRPATATAKSSVETKKQGVSLKLEAVMQLGQQRVAVINGKALKQGQSLLGATIKEINTRSVVIVQEDNGVWESKTLWVAQSGSVKTKAAENY